MRVTADFDFRHLSPAERIRLALDLWDSLDAADIEAAFPLTPAQAAELDRRVAEMDHDGDSGLSWEAVRTRVRAGVPLGPERG